MKKSLEFWGQDNRDSCGGIAGGAKSLGGRNAVCGDEQIDYFFLLFTRSGAFLKPRGEKAMAQLKTVILSKTQEVSHDGNQVILGS